MITLTNGWVQWDGQIGTFHGVIDGVSYGTHTGHILTPEAFEAVATITLSEDEKALLRGERDNAVENPANPNPIDIDTVDFINRFTQEEMAAILTAAHSIIQVEVLVFRLQNTTKIDLRNQNVIEAVEALAVAGLLTESRKKEVLGLLISSV